MENFIRNIEKWKFDIEMVVDWKIFDKKTILRAAYELVDKVYMFFKKDWDEFIVQFKLKDKNLKLDDVVNTFWEELVFHNLRAQIDKKTWKMKQRIIETALGYSLSLEDIKEDLERIIPWSVDWWGKWQEANQKSIDEIMKEIESDPDFEDDKDEILWILKEINEEESDNKKNN